MATRNVQALIFLVCCTTTLVSAPACIMAQSASTGPGGTQRDMVIVEEQVVKYYIHDNLLQRTGNNTAFIVAGQGGNVSQLNQGSIVAIDDLITEEPEPASRKLGNAQGLYLISTFFPELPHIHQQFTAIFTGKYNGTIAYQGDDNLFRPVREIAVVGGTGQFRRASGYALITTIRQTDAWSYILGFETHLFIPQPTKHGNC